MTGAVIHHAIQQGLLQKEQLVGIEDLVMGEKAFEEMRRQRMVHVTSVLKAQKLMQERNSNGVDTAMLAKVASMSSSKSVKKAWLRAVWSLDNVTDDSAKLARMPSSRSWATSGNASTRAANAA